MAATEEIEKEILAEMAANPVPYAAGQVNDVITIDGETRMISVPASEIFFGVESDKDVERKHFRCPKVVGDGIDLSKHQIYISYITSDSAGKTFSGNAGLYLCEDVATDGDDITFSWQLSGNVFASAGFIAFKVLAAKTDGENVQTRWNTVPAIGTVLMTVPDGMDIGEAYPDIVTQLLERMASVEKIATEEAMQGYVNTYLEAHPGEIDETLTDPKKAAPASVVGELKEDLDDLSESYNQVNRKNTFHIFRIGGSSISNAVLKKDSENPYYCVLIDASVNKKFTISHTDTGTENGYRQFKAVGVDVTIDDMLAWGDNKGISTDHIEWLFAETGDYVQTKNVTVSDSMKTLVVQFSKDILPEYMEILIGIFETQKYSSYRNAFVPIGDVYSKFEAENTFIKKFEAENTFIKKSEAENYAKIKQNYMLENGRLTICVGKTKFWIERRNDSSINLDTWLIQRMYINDVVIMAGTDIEGPIKQVGASDFTGGIHGDEKYSEIQVFADGKLINLSSKISETKFKEIDVFVKSVIYFCDTTNVAFNRSKRLCFKNGKTSICNTITYIGKEDYSVYRWPASGIFSIYKDLMSGYVTNTDCDYITNTGKVNDVNFDEITFLGENYTAKIKNTGKKYNSYVGFVQDFSGESRPRFKAYFDTLDNFNGDVILKTNDKVFASYEIEVN